MLGFSVLETTSGVITGVGVLDLALLLDFAGVFGATLAGVFALTATTLAGALEVLAGALEATFVVFFAVLEGAATLTVLAVTFDLILLAICFYF
jgi:hypothetical protein